MSRLRFVFAALAAFAFGSATAAADIKLPDYQTVRLDNGATLLLAPRKDVPMVAATVLVRGGALADPAGKEGTAGLLAELLAQGALDAVAADGVRIDLARDGQAQPRRRVIGQPVQGKAGIRGAPAALEHAGELGLRAHPRRGRKAGAEGRRQRDDAGILSGHRRLGHRWQHHCSPGAGAGDAVRPEGQTVRRRRPLARRRANTLRPSAVAMRARKP